MDKFTVEINNLLVGKVMRDKAKIDKINEPLQRRKIAYLEAWVSIIGNLVLAVIKVIFGVMINSISLIADAAHTASDVLTSLVVILGFKLSSMPADEKHPHGHGRIEFIATMIISLMLMGVGVKFCVDSYGRFLDNTPVTGSFLVAVIMVLAGLFKEWMSRMSIDLGQRINSSALVADAWHHRTDAIASVLVAVAIVASGYGYYRVDAILGLAVSALIIFTGIEIFKESGSKLIGESTTEQLDEINQLAMTIPGVVATHDISVHDYGANKAISIHIEVDQKLSINQAHDIAHEVEETINKSLYALTTVHIDTVRNYS
ncbi:cation diffusion facilitator family transporter [Syntrophomonas erecta]